jgi:tetratricopeptide (TPR) repeat protein
MLTRGIVIRVVSASIGLALAGVTHAGAGDGGGAVPPPDAPGARPISAPIPIKKLREAAALCDEGRRALLRKDAAAATHAFEKALAAVPDFPDAYVGLGHAGMLRAEFESALASYRRAESAWRALGQAIYDVRAERYNRVPEEIRQREDEISNLRNSIAGVPLDSQESRIRELQREIDALRGVRMPLRNEAGEPPAEVFFGQGNALFRLDRLEDALAAWKLTARREPSFAAVHNNMAVVLLRLGRPAEARSELAEAVRLGLHVDPGLEARVAAAEKVAH